MFASPEHFFSIGKVAAGRASGVKTSGLVVICFMPTQWLHNMVQSERKFQRQVLLTQLVHTLIMQLLHVTTGLVFNVPTNKPTSNFYRSDALLVVQPTASEHWRGKVSHYLHTHRKLIWTSTLSLTTKASWLPWGWRLSSLSSAFWRQYPINAPQIVYNYVQVTHILKYREET